LSGIRESLRCANEVKNKYLKVWSILNFTLPIVFFLLFVNLLVMDIIYFDIKGIFVLFISLFTISLFAELPILVKNPKMITIALPFMIYNILFITPLWFVSLFKQDETIWGTR